MFTLCRRFLNYVRVRSAIRHADRLHQLTRKQYYEKARRFLINPVQKVVTVKRDKSIQNMTYAGETALSRMSMLNPPEIEEVAVYKADMKINEFEMLDERLSEPTKLVRIQLWKYNPLLFASNGMVDKVSLACSFIDNKDERIESSIEEMLEEI